MIWAEDRHLTTEPPRHPSYSLLNILCSSLAKQKWLSVMHVLYHVILKYGFSLIPYVRKSWLAPLSLLFIILPMSKSFSFTMISTLSGFGELILTRLSFWFVSSYLLPSLNLSVRSDVVSLIWIFIAFLYVYAISCGIVTHLSYVLYKNVNFFKDQYLIHISILSYWVSSSTLYIADIQQILVG